MVESLYSLIKELMEIGYLRGVVSERCDGGMNIIDGKQTFDGKDFQYIDKMNSVDKEQAVHLTIYEMSKDINYVMHIYPQFISAMANTNLNIRPIGIMESLILGGKLSVCLFNPQQVSNAIKEKGAVPLINNGLILAGSEFEGLVNKAAAIERSAIAYVKAAAIAKPYVLVKKIVREINNAVQFADKASLDYSDTFQIISQDVEGGCEISLDNGKTKSFIANKLFLHGMLKSIMMLHKNKGFNTVIYRSSINALILSAADAPPFGVCNFPMVITNRVLNKFLIEIENKGCGLIQGVGLVSTGNNIDDANRIADELEEKCEVRVVEALRCVVDPVEIALMANEKLRAL